METIFLCAVTGNNDSNSTTRENASNVINNDCVNIPPFSHDEVSVAIQRFNNNAAGHDGQRVEFLRP